MVEERESGEGRRSNAVCLAEGEAESLCERERQEERVG